ncbi:MAG: hypothetical protein WCY09_08825 [Candidatus Omnitrophota bacterium]|jgi:hypothetical protein
MALSDKRLAMIEVYRANEGSQYSQTWGEFKLDWIDDLVNEVKRLKKRCWVCQSYYYGDCACTASPKPRVCPVDGLCDVDRFELAKWAQPCQEAKVITQEQIDNIDWH